VNRRTRAQEKEDEEELSSRVSDPICISASPRYLHSERASPFLGRGLAGKNISEALRPSLEYGFREGVGAGGGQREGEREFMRPFQII